MRELTLEREGGKSSARRKTAHRHAPVLKDMRFNENRQGVFSVSDSDIPHQAAAAAAKTAPPV